LLCWWSAPVSISTIGCGPRNACSLSGYAGGHW